MAAATVSLGATSSSAKANGATIAAVQNLDDLASVGEEGLARPCGPAEGFFAEAPLSDLVLHINRELIHHGAEICLLRDLYLRRTDDEESA